MKIINLLFASSLAITGGIGISSPSFAGYNCTHSDIFGTRCTGSINGQRVDTTTTHSEIFGSRTTGTVGGQRIDVTCTHSEIFGTTCN